MLEWRVEQWNLMMAVLQAHKPGLVISREEMPQEPTEEAKN
jgi:hypothetical protein